MSTRGFDARVSKTGRVLRMAVAGLAMAGLAACSTSWEDEPVRAPLQPVSPISQPLRPVVAPPPAPVQPAPPPAPTGPSAGTAEDFLINVQDRVFFTVDRYDLDADDRDVLERQAAWLLMFPRTTIIVEGHADERGTREYNLALAARRAQSVKDYLVSLGIEPSRVRTVSYGKERPVAPGSNEAAWRLNRRGVTVIESAPGS